MNYVIEFSDGSHGILPNDNLEYSVTRGRVIVYKDGEKVLDKEIGNCPSGKCEIITAPDAAPDVQVLPVDGEVVNKDIEPEGKVDNEYNIGTMLPQGCGVVPTVNQAQLMMAEDDASNAGDVEEIGPISPEANVGFLKKYIEDCRKKLEYEKNKPTPNQSIIDDIKAKLDKAVNNLRRYEGPDLKVIANDKPNYVAASDNSVEEGDTITESVNDSDEIEVTFTLTEAANSYINLENDNVEESAKDVILNFVTEVNVSRKIRVLIVELALMRARLDFLTKTNAKKEKIAELKRNIIAKEKEKRSLLEGQNNEVKSAVKKIEKAAVKEAKKDVKKEEVKTESIVDVIPLVEETKDDGKEKKSLHVSIREEKIKKIDEKLATLNKEPRANTSQIKALEEEKEKLKFEMTYHNMKKDEEIVKEEETSKVSGPIKFETSNYVDVLSSFVNEAANIDPAIKDIIASLNAKGYKTRYSSAGHFKLRKKEDREPDGVYNGKLYSDARVQFKGTYHFGAAPKYWFWKKVDGDDYLDVVPLVYNDKDGTPDEAFAKWRTNYLNSLDAWVKKLPSADNNKNDEPTPKDTQIKEESAKINTELDNYFDSIFRENGIRE